MKAAHETKSRQPIQSSPANRGFAQPLGLDSANTSQLLERIEQGLPFHSLELLQIEMGLTTNEMAELLRIPLRTLSRRKQAGKLEPGESDRLVRISRLWSQALDLFEGHADWAIEWLKEPHRALDGVVPLSLAKSEAGAREVETLIGRISYSVLT